MLAPADGAVCDPGAAVVPAPPRSADPGHSPGGEGGSDSGRRAVGGPETEGVRVRTIDLVDADDGVDFGHGVVLDTRTSGRGDRLALVLPGAERAVEDAAFLDALADRFHVVMPSHPGFGRSARPDWCSSVDDLAYLYLDWLDRSDHRDVTLVGLQFGGWVALEMAVRSSTRLAQLVLVDSVGLKLGAPTEREIADVFALPQDQLHARIYADPGFGLADLSEAAEDDLLETMRNDEALATYGWEPYLHNPRLTRWLWRVRTPTSVVWGGRDGVVAPDYGRGLAERIPGARFDLVEGVGHRPQVERPAEVARLVPDPVA